jgi:hypothetical protein
MRDGRIGGRLAGALLPVLAFAGCASSGMILDMRATVMYDKPAIKDVSHTIAERHQDEGPLVVAVTMKGDPGLVATFDISPGITDRQPMKEVADGVYQASYTFAPDVYGGPYWVTGRLWHEKAGEHVMRDPVALTIALPGR